MKHFLLHQFNSITIQFDKSILTLRLFENVFCIKNKGLSVIKNFHTRLLKRSGFLSTSSVWMRSIQIVNKFDVYLYVLLLLSDVFQFSSLVGRGLGVSLRKRSGKCFGTVWSWKTYRCIVITLAENESKFKIQNFYTCVLFNPLSQAQYAYWSWKCRGKRWNRTSDCLHCCTHKVAG